MKKLLLFLVAFSLTSFFVPEEETSVVRIHELSDPDMLNPYNYSDANSGYILYNIFPTLLSVDFRTLRLVPLLADKRPLIEKTQEGKLRITYTIRKEAVWDNGKPVTAKDVEFSIKVIKNPLVNNGLSKPFYEFIEKVELYPADPKKITIVCRSPYLLAEASSGDYAILPEYFYDPKHLMKKFSIEDLGKDPEALKNNKNIIDFANDFNSEKRMREQAFISGCGAYRLAEWRTGQFVRLEKKKNWWGDTLKK